MIIGEFEQAVGNLYSSFVNIVILLVWSRYDDVINTLSVLYLVYVVAWRIEKNRCKTLMSWLVGGLVTTFEFYDSASSLFWKRSENSAHCI